MWRITYNTQAMPLCSNCGVMLALARVNKEWLCQRCFSIKYHEVPPVPWQRHCSDHDGEAA